MTGAEVRAWRIEHNLTLMQLADRLGVMWITVQRWESGVARVPGFLHLALAELHRQLAQEKIAAFVGSVVGDVQ